MCILAVFRMISKTTLWYSQSICVKFVVIIYVCVS